MGRPKASAAPLLPRPGNRDGADDEIHGNDQGRPHRSACGELRSEEGRDQHGLEHSREHCNDRDEEERQVRYPGCCDDQDPPEEGDQGREARGLRQSRHGEGEAGKDCGKGLPRESTQGRVLRVSRSAASAAKRLRVCSSISSSSTPPEEYSCHFVQVGWRVRGHAWPSGSTTLGEGDHMYSTSVSQKK